MAGENALGNAVLGGASDYIADVGAYFGKIYSAPPSERVLMILLYNIAWLLIALLSRH